MMSISTLINENFPELRDRGLAAEISDSGRFIRVKEGEKLMDYGSEIVHMPLLISGALKILRMNKDASELILYYLQAGETCAMSLTCCLANQKSEIRAVAEEDSEIILLPAQLLDSWMLKYPTWKNFVMQTYQDRFVELLNAIDSIAFKKMDERLLQYLIDKSTINNNHVLETTHQKIAEELNSTREVISRLLKQLENQEKIELGRNRIVVKF